MTGAKPMEEYTKQDLEEALRAIASTLHKCEKAFEKLREGTPQHTLAKNRIKALRISINLINKALEDAV